MQTVEPNTYVSHCKYLFRSQLSSSSEKWNSRYFMVNKPTFSQLTPTKHLQMHMYIYIYISMYAYA